MQTCSFGKFGKAWPSPAKIIVSICKKLSCSSECKKSTSFFRYCKEISNLLFWVIWACLSTHTKNNSINLKKPLMHILRQKTNFTLHVFLKSCKPIGNLLLRVLIWTYFGYTQKGTINLWKTFVLSRNKKSASSPKFLWRYWQSSYFGYFGHAWLCTSRTIVSSCKNLQCSTACQK